MHSRRAMIQHSAVVAGLLVGLVTAMSTQFFPQAAGVAMYLLMAAILLVRPRGLLPARA